MIGLVACMVACVTCPVGSMQGTKGAARVAALLGRDKPVVMVSDTGEIVASNGLDVAASVQFGVKATDWGTGYVGQDQVRGMRVRTEGNTRVIEGVVTLPGNKGRTMQYRQEVSSPDDHELRIVYRFRFPEEVAICEYHVRLIFGISPFVGQSVVSSGGEQRSIKITPQPGPPVLIVGSAGQVAVAPEKSEGITLACDDEMDFWLQDNRTWGGKDMEARFRFMQNEQPVPVAAGTTVERAFTLRFNKPVRVALDSSIADAVDMSGWMPWAPDAPVSPVDLSDLNDTPAGRRGFLMARGGSLVWSDGTPARLWGIHLRGEACFPERPEAEVMARHLASVGVNLLRLEGALPLLGSDSAEAPEPERLAKLDDLIRCLKDRGAYVCLDVPVGLTGSQRGRAFLKALLDHRNAATNVAYKAEPGIALLQLYGDAGPFASTVAEADAQTAMDAERKFLDEATAFLRGSGVRALISASSWGRSISQTASMAGLDVLCGHCIYDWPTYGGDDASGWPMAGTPPGLLVSSVCSRAAGKPFIGMRTNVLWTMDLRAEALLALAAIAAFQGWDGFVSHVYRKALGGRPGTMPDGECWNDPAVMALAPHVALILRRGDVSPGRKVLRVAAGGDQLVRRVAQGPYEMAAFLGAGELHRVEVDFAAPEGAPGTVGLDARTTVEGSADFVSDTGQLIRSIGDAFGSISTPRTKAVYGVTAGTRELGEVRMSIASPYATVALSSLTDQPIASSGSLLLTAVGRADNTGTKYNVLHTERVSAGHGPILVEPIEADVSIRTDRKLVVRPVHADGKPGEPLDATYAEGRLSFHIGAAHRAVHYRIGE